MYVREKLVKFLKVKNVILSIFGVFMLAVALSDFLWLLYMYWGDRFTLERCKSMPFDIFWMSLSPILIIHTYLSKRRIGDVYFFNSYFEGNISGTIEYDELVQISGMPAFVVPFKVSLFRLLYMKNFRIVDKRIVLNDEKVNCSCKNCGALIEKSIYFAGKCQYCQSSDLMASVIVDNRFYSITHSAIGQRKKKEFYTNKKIQSRIVLFTVILCLVTSLIAILSMYFFDCLSKYNDKKYLVKTLFSGKPGLGSFELIKRHLLGQMEFALVFILALIPCMVLMVRRILCVATARRCALYLSKCKNVFTPIEKMPKKRKPVKESICHNYLINCSFARHEDKMYVAVARNIVKDTCPGCGATITEAVHEDYVCKYCNRKIMHVMEKRDS